MLPAGLLVVLAASLAAVVPAAAPLPSPSGRGVGGEVRLAGPAGHCAWESEFEVGDVDGAVEALAVFDDGNGPALYAGGLFPAAGRFKASNVARWDGAKWSPLAGPSGEGTSGMVLDLAVYDDGSGPALYAAGSFIFAGGVPASRVARWDGTSWSALGDGSGPDDLVTSLEVFDDGGGPALYAGGHFATLGGTLANYVARWDGTAWSTLDGPSGTGLGSSVVALEVYDDGDGPDLYAGGFFTTAGGAPASRIARWDGAAWSTLTGPSGEGTSNYVYALSVFDDGDGDALFVGGGFMSAGGVPATRIARWDGAAWSAVAGSSGIEGTDRNVHTLSTWDDGASKVLCAGGTFDHAGGVFSNNVACWDGTEWMHLDGPAGTGTDFPVKVLITHDDGGGPALFVGGWFHHAGGVFTNSIARWDGSGWSDLEGPGLGLDVPAAALEAFTDPGGPALYVAGAFEMAGRQRVDHVARWDGSTWSALAGESGIGTDLSVSALRVFDDGTGTALYAGGPFREAGGLPAYRIARWDGTDWSTLDGPTGPTDRVAALTVYDDGGGDALYAGGLFLSIGGIVAHHVARWDGSAWSPLAGPTGTGTSRSVSGLATWDDGRGEALYAAGGFATAGGVDVSNVARWDGATWSPLTGPSGTGVSGQDAHAIALAVYDDGSGPALYVGGYFAIAGGLIANNVARWDGREWSILEGPSGIGTSGRVSVLTVFDDGTGPALYVGGLFYTAGGVQTYGLARWDGTGFSAVAGGVFEARGLEVWDDGGGPALWAAGNFRVAGEYAASNLATWRCGETIFADGFESGDASAWSSTHP